MTTLLVELLERFVKMQSILQGRLGLRRDRPVVGDGAGHGAGARVRQDEAERMETQGTMLK